MGSKLDCSRVVTRKNTAQIRPGSAGLILAVMPDLRTLSLDQRQALAREAETRARAGQSPNEIRAALGLSKVAYQRWAKLFGFRQCDLYPDLARGGRPATHPPGPGGYVSSGQRFCGRPLSADDPRFVYGPDHPAWRGGTAAWRQRDLDKRSARRSAIEQEFDQFESIAALQCAVLEALDAGDKRRADQLLAAWQREQRRERALMALDIAVEKERWDPDSPGREVELTDEEIVADLSRIVGRTLKIAPDPETAESGGGDTDAGEERDSYDGRPYGDAPPLW